MNEAETPRVFDVLAKSFLQEDVGAYFALLGDANMYWGSRLIELGCNVFFVRHEHCAVNAAAAYTRVSGRIGVATMTCGPGLTQVMTALSIAVKARIPMVVFAGEAPVGTNYYNQYIDQAPFVTATGAAYNAVHSPERMPLAIRDAFVQAKRERRPVVLGIPMDLQDRPWPLPHKLPAPSAVVEVVHSPIPPNVDDVRRAVAMIESAQKVVVMGGAGAIAAKAADACKVLAERCKGILAETLPARGLFLEDPFSVSLAGGFSKPVAKELLGEADLVIAVGCSLAHHNADGGKLWPQANLLQIDIEPVAIRDGRVAAQAHMRADALLGVEAINAAVESRATGWRSDAIAERIQENRVAVPYTLGVKPEGHHPAEVVSAIEHLIPADWFMVQTSGHISAYTTNMPSRPAGHFLNIREFGAIGNGTSFAIGAAAARPNDTIVLLDGDGSFLMHIQELETIRRHGLRVLVMVLNDGAYGSEIHKLRARGMTDKGTVFGRTDFAAIAKGFGMGGERIDDLAQLPELIEQFSRSTGSAVWDVPISDKISSPLRGLHAGHIPA